MAETFEKVLLGDTTRTAVEKINVAITQVNTNADDIEELKGKSYIPTSQKGQANGVATLDTEGKVPSSQLPSYVDDVIEGYYYNGKFYKESAHTTEITAEAGKIYSDLSSNKTYRWGGSAYVEISSSLALGTTAGTAYDGAAGKANAEAIADIQEDYVSASATLVASQILLGDGDRKAKASGYTISTSAPSTSDTTKIPTSAAVKSAITSAVSSGTTNMVTASSTLTADQILLGGGSKTAKASGKKIATSIADAESATDNNVPTEKAVRTLVDSVTVEYVKAVRIGSDTFELSETITDEDNGEPKYYVYKSVSAYAKYIPVVVYNSAYQSMVIEMRSDTAGYVYLVTSPDEAIFGELRYVILNYAF